MGIQGGGRRQSALVVVLLMFLAFVLTYWHHKSVNLHLTDDPSEIIQEPVMLPQTEQLSRPLEDTEQLSQPPQHHTSFYASDQAPHTPSKSPTENPSSTPISASQPDTRPVAVIIETDVTRNLIPIILHFATVLGPSWGLILFTVEEGWSLPASPSFRRAVDDGRVEVRFLPPDIALRDSGSVSRFLAQPWLWEQVEHAERMLMFQIDSILCSKAETVVDDFLEYDYLGAPIAPKFGHGYNGGLSLRNPRLFLNITREVSFAESGAEFEDQWFFSEAKKRVETHGVNLPDAEVAKKFSVETIYYDKPLGYHQPQRWQADKMDEIMRWCPEVGMLVGRRAT